MPGWKTLSSRVVYENPYVIVHEDQVINPAGKRTIYGYFESANDSIIVVPVDDAGNTWLVRQFRYPLGKEIWECVAGHADGQSPTEAAKRELSEETGLDAAEITVLGEVNLADNISTFKNAVCLARGLTQKTGRFDNEDGILEARKVTLTEVVEEILAGKITCGPSIAAVFMAKAYLERGKA